MKNTKKTLITRASGICRNVDGGLAEKLHAEKLPGIKNPLNLCLAAEATIGMAGVLPDIRHSGAVLQDIWYRSNKRTPRFVECLSSIETRQSPRPHTLALNLFNHNNGLLL
ncbi:hypothetical protein, partial [Pseudomonas amygdali]|uniref:hypothetical protein n=1 Tax=Pseudomonas amygdali TaxID=47877 RepID=UPI0011C405D1